jgi:hypothetical protein
MPVAHGNFMGIKTAIHIFILLVMSGFVRPGNCQSAFSENLYVRTSYRPGIVLPEYPLFTYLAEEYVRAFNVAISHRPTGTNFWAQLYHQPEYGLAIQWSTLGNPDVFGDEFSIYPFVGIPYINGKTISLWNQIGLGVGLANKKYDPKTNPYNVAIGSTANIHFNFELNMQYRLRRKFFTYGGICFDHLSNGNLSEPNLGINTMTFNAGVRYLIGEESAIVPKELESHQPTSQWAVLMAFGSKRARSLQDKSYLISSLSLEYKYKLFRIANVGAGVDVFYDGATAEEIRAFGSSPYAAIDDYKTGFHLSQELIFNKFSIALQEGFYVGLKDKAFNNAAYHRFIIRHRIGERWFASLAMKAHFVVLDYLELGAGYIIKP